MPWFHIVTILTKAPGEHRAWYAAQTIAGGWSRLTLERNISGRLHERGGAAVSNFDHRLPAQLVEALPKNLRAELPSIEEIESQLAAEMSLADKA